MKYRVLVAEDEMIERKLLCKTISKYLGELCVVYEAKNGREALEIYGRECPQIALLDIEMPGINGLEAARQMRDFGRDCEIIFVTGFDKFSYAKQAISIRAREYLLKPYNEKELIYAVEEAIQHIQSGALKNSASQEQETTGVRFPDGAENIRLSRIREDIKNYLELHYAENISMQSTSQTMGYSESYFCKLFKDCFHVNFSTYLNEFRIEKAKAMMTNTRGNVKYIGLACGYSDPNYFARVFKRMTGRTPSEYRDSVSNNG